MAALRVLAFDHEGRLLQFDTWLDNIQLFLLSNSRDSISLFDHTFGAAPAPPATADSATRSQWLTRDVASRLAIRNHLQLAECAHFGQHRTVQALYDTVVARYSSPATAALGCLILPYLFPNLSAFATVEDLASYLRTSKARYRLPPQLNLTIDLLEQHLLAAKTSVVAVGAARGSPRTPYFEGCSPSPLAPSYASTTAVDVPSAEDVGAASASAKHCSSKGKGDRGGGRGSGSGGGGNSGGGGGTGGGGSGGSGGASGGFGGCGGGSGGSGGSGIGGSGGGRTGAQRGGSGGGQRQRHQRRSETPLPQQLREWLFQRGTSGGSDSCPYVIRTGDRAGQTCGRPHTQHRCFSRLNVTWRAEFGDEVKRPHWADLLSAKGDYYRCMPPDPGIEVAALGAIESSLPGTAPAEALHTFTLDSGDSRCFFRDSTTLNPLPTPVPVRLGDPSGGPVVARSSTILPCLAVLSGSVSGLHLSSFSTNLVRTAALQDSMVTTTTPGGQRVLICTCTRTGRHQATFTRRPVSSLYTLATKPPHVAVSAQVSALGQIAPPCSFRLLSHQTLLWHHGLGHPSPPCLRGMHSPFLVSGLPESLPPLPPSPPLPCLPCVEGRQRAAPHSSLFPQTSAPLKTLHMDVWGPACASGQGRERYFLLVVDDYLRYTTVFPLRSNGGEFSSDLLRDFCRGEGITQSCRLPTSPQQNGIAECHIGLVMEVARTSMIHAAAPHFLRPFAVRYAAHQLNLWPRVSLPETLPTLHWTGKFYHPTLRRVLSSQDVTFDESVPLYHLFPYRSAPPPPPPLILAPGPPSIDPLLPQGPAPSGVSQVDPLLDVLPVEVACDSGAARGAASGGVGPRGAEHGGAESEGAGSRGAEPRGAEPEGAEPAGVATGGAEPEGVEPWGAESEGEESWGAEPRAA
ncbi:unnamed protein product [Closterium sp. NIES-53]